MNKIQVLLNLSTQNDISIYSTNHALYNAAHRGEEGMYNVAGLFQVLNICITNNLKGVLFMIQIPLDIRTRGSWGQPCFLQQQ